MPTTMDGNSSFRLLHVVTSYQSVVTILASKLRLLAPSTDLLVASSFDNPAEQRPCPVDFFDVDIRRKISPWADLLAACRLASFIRKAGVDLVHTHTAKAGIVGAMAAIIAGVPVVHTYHGAPWFSGQNALLNSIYRRIEFFFSRWRRMVFSQNVRDFLELQQGDFPCPVMLEGNGVDVEEVQSNASAHRSEVESLWPRGNFRIVCLARLEPVKRVETVIECVKYLRDEGLDPALVIAGRGPQESRIRSLVENYGLRDRVAIFYTNFTHALINLADVAVLSSIKEGIPRGLMEAMALAKPVVATDVLGTAELVIDGQTGFLAPLGDQQAFNKAVRNLALSSDLRAGMGAAGRRRVLEHFSERKIVDLWMREYRRILAGEQQHNAAPD